MTNESKHKILCIVFASIAAILLGTTVFLAHICAEQREANGEINRQMDALEAENESLESECELLIDEKTELDTRITQMLDEIESIGDSLEEKNTVIDEFNVLTGRIREEIAAKEAEAEKLEQEIAALEQKNEITLLITEKMRESRNEAIAEAEELQRKMDVLLRAAEETKPETEAIVPDEIPVTAEPEPIGAEAELYNLLKYGAPYRYVTLEDGSLISEPSYIAYAYYDFTTGKSVTYHSDNIIYAASVIKAPFVYAVIREIEEFEKNKRDFDADGNPLWDADGNPLYEGGHPNYDGDGNIVYLEGEEKYNLDEIWTFDPETMMEEGSGEIMSKPAGFQLTWRELIEYALLYSDNIAFAQIRDRFGYTSFYQLVAELGIQGTATGFMNLSADDCVKFLTVMHDYMADGSEYALWMKDCMVRSKHSVILARNFPDGTCAHKYGWDIDAYHDAAVIFDEHPYALVVMSNLHDGGDTANDYFSKIAELTKQIHAEQYAEE